MKHHLGHIIVDVWANPTGVGANLHEATISMPLDILGANKVQAAPKEVHRLFEQSKVDPKLTERKLAPKELISLMDDSGVGQICLAAWYRPGETLFSNEEVAEYTRAYPTRIYGLASVNLPKLNWCVRARLRD